jgi:hypothetical protein
MPFSPAPRRPDPEPLEADDVAIVTAGTVLWAVALLVAFVLRDRLADGGNENWTWIFLAGAFLGLIGIRHVRRRRAALRRNVPKIDVVEPGSQG